MSYDTDRIRSVANNNGIYIEGDSILSPANDYMLDAIIQNCMRVANCERQEITNVMHRRNILTSISKAGFGWDDAVALILAEFRADHAVLRKTIKPTMCTPMYPDEMHGIKTHPKNIPAWYVKPAYWDEEINEMTYYLSLGEKRIRGFFNTMHVGPKGIGKTEYANIASLYLFNKPAEIIDPAHNPSKVVGVSIPVPQEDGSSKMVYTPSRFVMAIQQPGIVVLDEFGAGRADVLTLYNTVLASGTIETPEGPIKRHKQCIIMCCDNSVGNGGDGITYIRSAMDSSTLDRFSSFAVDEWNPAVARSLSAVFDEDGTPVFVDGNFVAHSEAWNKACIITGNMKATVSYRALITAAFKLAAGTSIKTIERTVIVRGVDKQRFGAIMTEMRKLDIGEYMDALNELYEEMPSKRAL